MPREQFPVRLLIQGYVSAYSKDQITDTVDRFLPEATDLLFGKRCLSSVLQVGEEELLFTGMKKSDLIEKVAKNIFYEEAVFKRKVYDSLKLSRKLLEQSSGVIFRHEGSALAKENLDELLSCLKSSSSFEYTPESIKESYRKRAVEILNSTVFGDTYSLLKEE